jgi:hypothetical protein
VPEDLDELSLKQVIPMCTKTVQCGKSRTFKVYFQFRTDLVTFLKASMKVGYERLPVEEFVFLPRRCFNCDAIGNLTVNCKNSALCSKCGSVDHKSTPDTPCQKSAFCVCCKTNYHTCYSVKPLKTAKLKPMDSFLLSWNINGSFTNKLSVLQSLSSSYNVIFLQEHFVTKHGINILTLDGMTSYSVPARKLNNRGRPSGGLVIFVKLALRSSSFKLNDHYLAVRVDSCV